MPWYTSNRRDRLPSDWLRRRAPVLARDSFDHIEHGDNHDLSNLQALCRWHHSRKSSAEGIAARKAKGGYKRQAREPEPHPLALQKRPTP
jgi:hypothetical protein